MKIEFYKMSGAGNDFVVIDNRTGKIKNKVALAKKLCERRFGIGADGLMLIEKAKDADYTMSYFNADGSYGGMCGNGGRCISYLAYKLGVAGKQQRFIANNRIYTSKILKDNVELTMLDPWDVSLNERLTIHEKVYPYHFINTGAPHVVIDVDEMVTKFHQIENIPVEIFGTQIRFHPNFAPEGTNVNFIKRESASKIFVRTYERGVEEETYACGTGSVASALVASTLWNIESPITVIPKSGKKLIVKFKKTSDTEFSNIHLIGPATITFYGSIDV
ncbi:MAG TPA: diaminopimelate epimerase [Bacteroidota bacterium]|nr:diaminopimelate epimerase [Bacteroidota bacterium]